MYAIELERMLGEVAEWIFGKGAALSGISRKAYLSYAGTVYMSAEVAFQIHYADRLDSLHNVTILTRW